MSIKKILFSQLNEELKVEKCTIPQAVSATKNPDEETFQQVVERQEKFLKLDEATKDKLCSYDTAKLIQEIGKQFGLELLQTACIARAVRSFYFKELSVEDFAKYFSKEIGISEDVANKITDAVKKKIVSDSSYVKSSTVQIALLDAMKKYPNLGEQSVTVNMLKLKYFSTPVRPSIKNWITDFHDNMGSGKHSAIDRGNYLFHSENGKKLTPTERQKLSLILKSLEEGSLLTIDPMSLTIISDVTSEDVQSFGNNSGQSASVEHFFNKENKSEEADRDIFQKYFGAGNGFVVKKPEETRAEQKPMNPEGTISFSSPQKLPVEQNAKPTEPPQMIKADIIQQPAIQTQPQPKLDANNVSFPRKRFQGQSQWQIKPRDFNENSDDDILKNTGNGNIVDLRK